MKVWIASAPARSGRSRIVGGRGRAIALWGGGLMTVMLAVAVGPPALAQAPPAQPAPKAQPKAQPKAAAATSARLLRLQGGAPEVPPLTYSPWTKVCLKGQEANAQQVCFTGKEGRIDTGMLVIGAVLIEPEGSSARLSASPCRSGCSCRKARAPSSIRASR